VGYDLESLPPKRVPKKLSAAPRAASVANIVSTCVGNFELESGRDLVRSLLFGKEFAKMKGSYCSINRDIGLRIFSSIEPLAKLAKVG
jgi:hypothetical protein